MAEAFIVDALRTPTGKRAGSLADTHPMAASAVLVCSEASLSRYQLKPRARIVHARRDMREIRLNGIYNRGA